MSSRFIHAVAGVRISFPLKAPLYCMNVPHFVYPFISQWIFGLFNLLAVVNNAAVNIGVQIPIRVPAFNYFEYILLLLFSP